MLLLAGAPMTTLRQLSSGLPATCNTLVIQNECYSVGYNEYTLTATDSPSTCQSYCTSQASQLGQDGCCYSKVTDSLCRYHALIGGGAAATKTSASNARYAALCSTGPLVSLPPP